MLKNRIKEYLKSNGLTHESLAKAADVSRSAISRLAKDPYVIPRSDLLNPLCDKLYNHPIEFIEYHPPNGKSVDPLLRGVARQLLQFPGDAGIEAAIQYLKSQKSKK